MIMSALSTSAAPVAPSPVASRNTSGGKPTSLAASTSIFVASGVTSLGLITIVLPAMSAGSASPTPRVSG